MNLPFKPPSTPPATLPHQSTTRFQIHHCCISHPQHLLDPPNLTPILSTDIRQGLRSHILEVSIVPLHLQRSSAIRIWPARALTNSTSFVTTITLTSHAPGYHDLPLQHTVCRASDVRLFEPLLHPKNSHRFEFPKPTFAVSRSLICFLRRVTVA